MPSISLVVTDLDGTLWDAGERIHERTLAALDGARAPRHAAAGRDRPPAPQRRRALAREGLAPPAVFLDGALGHDLRHRSTGSTARRSPPDGAADGARRVRPPPACRRACTSTAPTPTSSSGDGPSRVPSTSTHIGQWLARDDLDTVVAAEDVLAIGRRGPTGTRCDAVHGGIAADAEAAVVRDLFFGDATLIARPRGISKWQGVEAFCARQDLDPSRVLALGDGENDIELLTAPRVACVVSDGCEAALALADHVIEPAAAGGWCTVLDLV